MTLMTKILGSTAINSPWMGAAIMPGAGKYGSHYLIMIEALRIKFAEGVAEYSHGVSLKIVPTMIDIVLEMCPNLDDLTKLAASMYDYQRPEYSVENLIGAAVRRYRHEMRKLQLNMEMDAYLRHGTVGGNLIKAARKQSATTRKRK